MEINSVYEWLTLNKLSLHLGKTESILFGSKRRLSSVNTVTVKCGDDVIALKSEVTYLGVTFDQSLSGDALASKLLTKSSNKLTFFV